jgi:outer membrane protein OmpA-like peptidoglycan-associated protein
MMRIAVLCVLVFQCLVFSAQEENIKLSINPSKLYKKGSQALENNDLFLAYKYWTELKSIGFQNEDQKYQYSVLLYTLKDYEGALDGFLGLANAKYTNPLINYYICLLYNNVNQQKSSRDYAMFFIKQKANRTKYPVEYKHISIVKLYLDSFAYQVDTASSTVLNIEGEVNHSGAEFSPLILPEGILFGSQDMREVEFYNSTKNKKSKMTATRKIYKAVGSENIFKTVTEFPMQFDTLEISSFCYGIDKRIMYLTGCTYREDLKKYKCDLYVTKYKDNVWTNLEKVVELSDPVGSLTHVNMGYDVDKNVPVLYYASDKPGGRGGFDLYSASYNSRTLKFSGGKNLGGKINTNKDDITPFYHTPTNTLYFSSNGRGGLGGHDIYFSKLSGGIYYGITALERDINSPQDDVFFTPDKNPKKGYLVSNRYSQNSLINPHCCDDIFYYEKGYRKDKNSNEIELLVLDKKTKEIIKDFEYKLSNIRQDETALVETGKVEGRGFINIKDVADSTNFEVEVFNPNYYRKKQYIDMITMGNDSLASIRKQAEINDLRNQLKNKTLEINRLDIGSETIKRSLDEYNLLHSKAENKELFDEFMKKLGKIIGDQEALASTADLQSATPQRQRELTDEISSAVAQLEEMIKHTIATKAGDANALSEIMYDLDVAKKFLEEAEQFLSNRDYSNAAQKQRQALEVLSKVQDRARNLNEKQRPLWDEQSGTNRMMELENILKTELAKTKMAEADKNIITDFVSSHRNLRNTQKLLKNPRIRIVEIELDPIDFNPILLPLVEFEFDSFDLTPSARHIIDSLVVPVLNSNPKLKVELSAHTDSRGNDDYNESLSQKRANAIRFFLIDAKGVYPERLVAKGYGEYAPIAPNENPDGTDNPEGRQRNRRCEFRILKEVYDPY